MNVRAAKKLAAKELASSEFQRGAHSRKRSESRHRREFEDTLQSHLIEAIEPLAASAATRGAAQLAVPVLVPSHAHKDRSAPPSTRGARGSRQEAAEHQLSYDTVWSTQEWLGASQPRRWAEYALAPSPSLHHDVRSTACQAKRLQAELADATRQIKGQACDWDALVGQQAPLRAGGTTVRNMVDMTRALLEGLEGALVSRATALASGFHAWRCEATLARTSRLYQQELEKHHDQWAACLDHHKRNFEAESWAHAEQVMARKQLACRLRDLLVDRGVDRDRRALLSRLLRAWRGRARHGRELQGFAECLQVARRTHRSRFGDLHVFYLLWKLAVVRASPLGGQAVEVWSEIEALQKKMAASEHSHRDMLRRQMSEVEQCRGRAHHVVEAALQQWRLFERMQLARSALRSWRHCMLHRKHVRRKQHAAGRVLERSVETAKRAQAFAVITAWTAYTRSERQSRAKETALALERQQWEVQLAETRRAKALAVDRLRELSCRTRARGWEAAEAMLRRWVMSDRQRLKAAVMSAFRSAVRRKAQARRHQTAMSGAASRLRSGGDLAALQLTFLRWQSSARWAAEAADRERCLRTMQEQMEEVLCRRKAQCHGCMDVVDRSHQRTFCLKHFLGWARLVETGRECYEVVLRYSAFVRVRKLKEKARDVLESAFREWHRESRLAASQRHHQETQCSLNETRACVDRLRRERSSLQEQLGHYYRQIDHVTEMLQKEMRIKGEMAVELRNAYGKMMLADMPPVGAGAAAAGAASAASAACADDSAGALEESASCCSSEETLDLCSTPRAEESGGPATVGRSLLNWRSDSSEPPPTPSLPFASLADTADTPSPSSPHCSSLLHTFCTWDQAVARMSEEGLVRIQDPDATC